MGEVWAGRRVSDNLPVAIKVLARGVAGRPECRHRFEREARAVARITSDYVCPLLDRGMSDRAGLFLVFELLRGQSLAERLAAQPRLSFNETIRIILDTLHGVEVAHRAQVLHRDIKPSNIFLKSMSQGHRAVVLDFGVAKIVGQSKYFDEPSITAYDDTVGSVAYIAPEQIRGAARVDERADLYAVACVMFRMLTGRLPFEATSASILARQKLDRSAPSLYQATGVPWHPQLETDMAQWLARDPNERPRTAADAKRLLASWLDLAQRSPLGLLAGAT